MGKIPPPREIGRAAMLQRIFGSPYKYLREEVTLLPIGCATKLQQANRKRGNVRRAIDLVRQKT
jgi:hypothetical protein